MCCAGLAEVAPTTGPDRVPSTLLLNMTRREAALRTDRMKTHLLKELRPKAETIESFVRRNESAACVPSTHPLTTGVRANDGSPSGSPRVSFSRAGFDGNRGEALVYMAAFGPYGLESHFFLCERTGGDWHCAKGGGMGDVTVTAHPPTEATNGGGAELAELASPEDDRAVVVVEESAGPPPDAWSWARENR